MGVTGLWRLVEPTGKPVPVETLENKVLAVDISIWLHQMVKGYQDAKGAPLPNAHLMGLFQRLCKLLYFRIKPVFVFDGAFPELKKETIAKRQDNKNKYQSESEKLKRELAVLLSKKTAISSLLGKKISPKKSTNNQADDDIFKLPALPNKDEIESDSDDEDTSSGSLVDLHTVDLESENFKKMDVKEKYDLLIELKETRKMNSWGKIHEMPKKSDNFSDFQMQRLLKRRKVQECLQETEKEMGSSGMSLNELESLLKEEGIDTKIDTLPTRHIASSETTRFLLISNMKQAIANAKNREVTENKATDFQTELQSDAPSCSSSTPKSKTLMETDYKKDELEEDLHKAIQKSLEPHTPNTSIDTSKTDESWSTFMTDSDYSYDTSDSEENDGYEPPNISSAKAYIMQYSDFTSKAIDEIVKTKRVKKKNDKPKINEILEEINKEKSIIKDHVNLSSDEECEVVSKKQKTSHISVTINSEITSQSESDDNGRSVAVMETANKKNPMKKEESSIKVDLTSPKFDNAVVNVDEVDDDEELQRAIQMSLECASEKTPTSANIESDTNSSDDDFEEVTDNSVDPKPVVQITLDVGQALEDDIFADVFCETKSVENKGFENVLEKIKEEDSDEEVVNEIKIESLNSLEETGKVDTLPQSNKPKDKQIGTTLGSNDSRVTVSRIDDNVKSTSSIDKYDNTNKIADNIRNENYSTPEPQVLNMEPTLKNPVTSETLNEIVAEMQNKEDEIIQEKGRLDRVGRNITEQMTKEAQELLQIFGIPYIVAPMEAEAQCAFLENAKLTDGTITDDSDIWLFGGRTVYKNFFNQKKLVLQFLSERIEKSFNLSREQLILLAMLVGSDYTSGVPGVGPVTALEILASFPYNKKTVTNATSQHARFASIVAGLIEFKKWVRSGKKTDNTSLKKKLRNVKVTDDFPSVRVVQAYMEPNVDRNDSKFTWGEIDITVLRDYTKAKFGWSQNKLDEIVKPVLKRLQDRNTQKNIQDYFTRKVNFQNLEDQMSKRVKAAVQMMDPDRPEGEIVDEPATTKAKKSRKRKTNNTSTEQTNKASTDDSKIKRKHIEELPVNVVKVNSVQTDNDKAPIDIKINKTDRYQEIIPQREKDKRSHLQNKMKAIEVFRIANLDTRSQRRKRKPLQPKEKAELSDSDSE